MLYYIWWTTAIDCIQSQVNVTLVLVPELAHGSVSADMRAAIAIAIRACLNTISTRLSRWIPSLHIPHRQESRLRHTSSLGEIMLLAYAYYLLSSSFGRRPIL